MYFYDSVDYGYVSAFNLEDDDFSGSDWLVVVVGEKEQVTSVEGWLHTATKTKQDEDILHHKAGRGHIIS